MAEKNLEGLMVAGFRIGMAFLAANQGVSMKPRASRATRAKGSSLGNWRGFLIASSAVALCALINGARAAATAAEPAYTPDSSGLEEVVVTARLRSENLMDFPD